MRNSAITTFQKCPYNYYLSYVEQLETIPDQEPDNPLYVGTAIHYGAETESTEQMLKNYEDNYYILGDRHINEEIKLEVMLEKLLKVKHELGSEYTHEYYFTSGSFHGTVDLIVHLADGTVDLYDYKYCSKNSVEKYKESPQLHLYKYYLEQQGFKVRKLGFIFIPKCYIRQKQTEDLYQFRLRLQEELSKLEITVHYLEYDHNKVVEALTTAITALETKMFGRRVCDSCKFCKYQNYCLKGEDLMNLPNNVRRELVVDENPDTWMYADSYVGKSTFWDAWDDLLFINTDGNTDNTSSPVIRIKDEITVNGRVTNKVWAWDTFEELVGELEKQFVAGTLDFKHCALDLVEDLFEHCRLKVYDENKWHHESDGGFGKGHDIVRVRFTSTIKRLKNIGIHIIYISKELKETVTPKNGNAYDTFRPNISPKIANILAGTVDLTIRAYMDGDTRYIQLVKADNCFGGGRIDFKVKKCELNKDAFMAALRDAQKGKSKATPVKEEVKTVDEFQDKVEELKPIRRRSSKAPVEQVVEPKETDEEIDKRFPLNEEPKTETLTVEEFTEEPVEEPRRRSRRSKTE